MNKRMILMLLACVVVFGGVFGVQAMINKGMNDFFDDMPMPAVSITVADAEEDTWPVRLSAVGTAKAVNGTQLTTEAAGIVNKINFRSGEQVKAGQTLITLDDEADRAQLKALKAAAELAKAELERTQRLHRQGSASKAELDRAISQADQAVGNLTSHEARIAQKNIKAPFDGQLGIRLVNLGEFLSPGTPVVSLQQLSPIYVDFKLPESNLKALAVGQTITVTVDAWPDATFEGKVTAIEPGIDAATRSIKVQAEIENEDFKLRPGMFARVQLDLGADESVVVIPQSAVSFNPYGNAVFVVVDSEDNNGTAQKVVKRRFVRTGRTQGDYITILEGIEPGDTVATSGLLKLNNDTVIKISDEVNMEASKNPTPNNT